MIQVRSQLEIFGHCFAFLPDCEGNTFLMSQREIRALGSYSGKKTEVVVGNPSKEKMRWNMINLKTFSNKDRNNQFPFCCK